MMATAQAQLCKRRREKEAFDLAVGERILLKMDAAA
jgi:hypothetical protein